jgi:hypothetical protein
MPNYQYLSCHPLQGNLLSRLKMSDAVWGETINGNSTFAGSITLPKGKVEIDRLRTATTPDEAAVYVKSKQGNYVYGGIITSRQWDWANRQIQIEAQNWRSWVFNAFLAPKTDLTEDRVYSWDQKDQLQIAREILGFATEGGPSDGRPVIEVGTELSGVLRDLHVNGLDFKFAGELLDTMAQRSNGFEWDIDVIPDSSTGLPSLRLVTSFPERGAQIPGLLFFRRTERGGNIRLLEAVQENSSDRRTRVWATGEAETSPFAQDSDPGLYAGFTLLREKVSNYSSVKERTTLSEKAVAERQFLNPLTNLLSFRVQMEGDRAPRLVGEYSVGDRARLIFNDEWYDIDLPAARIISRTLRPFVEGGVVDIVLDLSDFEAPEADVQ